MSLVHVLDGLVVPPFSHSLARQICITSARIPGRTGQQQILVGADGNIEWMRATTDPTCPDGLDAVVCDVAGDWISLGGVDLQINGALGLAFPDLMPGDEAQLEAIAEYLWQQGVDAFLPTVVTTAPEKVHWALAALAAFTPAQPATAAIWGAHLEGPFLNPAKRGAPPAVCLQPLSVSRVQRLLADWGAGVKVMTLAPELDPSGQAIDYLRTQNIFVSLGHSLATAAEAHAAFNHGATLVTHAFNAMPPLHHRHPGLLAAAVLDERVHCGFIADGQHVDPLMLSWLIRAGGTAGLFLVSDALAPLGLPGGQYPWDERQMTVVQGTARLPDGTLSGTTLPLLTGVQNLVRWGCCDLETAIALATESPRSALGQPGLGAGQSALNLLRWQVSPGDGAVSWLRFWPALCQLGQQLSAVNIS